MESGKLIIGGVGLGVVGSILAAHLGAAGAEIIVTDLPHRLEQIENHGIKMQWGEKKYIQPVKTVATISELVDLKPDILFISTKTYSLKSIINDLERLVGSDTLVISVQNGIDPEDFIAGYIPPENVARMVVNYAGVNDASWVTTVNWFNPPNYIGPVTEREDPRLERMVGLMNDVGLTTCLVSPTEIKKRAFLKTILNAALMPICAVLGLTMKEAMTCKIIRGYAGDILEEGFALAGKLGFDYGPNIHEECMVYLDKGGHHYPSMYWDLIDERPTEIEFLNGKLVEIGVRYPEIDLSINRIFVSLVVSREIKSGTRCPDDIPEYLSRNNQGNILPK